MSHQIQRGKPQTGRRRKRWGVLEVVDGAGQVIKVFLYVIGNRLSLKAAKKNAGEFVKSKDEEE